ncbi:hypothetical protein ACP70R_017920 [Stipagrostis hirtigluma subsp. patula]
MEPRRGEEQLVMWGTSIVANDAGAVEDVANRGGGACLCPVAPTAPASSSGRHALEQEVLYRADQQLTTQAAGGGGGDRRRERMIKNRASAARSRARRHAYVNELEKEVRLLREENDQLRKLCKELKEDHMTNPGDLQNWDRRNSHFQIELSTKDERINVLQPNLFGGLLIYLAPTKKVEFGSGRNNIVFPLAPSENVVYYTR